MGGLFIQGTVIALIIRKVSILVCSFSGGGQGEFDLPTRSPEDAMLWIGTWLPEASEEEAGRCGAVLGPLTRVLKAPGNPRSPNTEAAPSRMHQV